MHFLFPTFYFLNLAGALKELFVVYTDREDRTRIISARKADKSERRSYYGDGYLYFA
ncbi:MAG: BrnT family toxin [Selenomonadaceae bacterium]|nr:BrnT family toxin [Selenomonadaceae bacterium]